MDGSTADEIDNLLEEEKFGLRMVIKQRNGLNSKPNLNRK